MTLALKVPNHAGGEAGSTVLVDLAADLLAIETESNRVSGIVQQDGKIVAPDAISLGGIEKSAWPAATPGSSGQVIQTGAIALKGMDGSTVTHNKGDLSYQVKINLTGSSSALQAGQISYVKSANTVVIYNTGKGSIYNQPITADIEISAL